MELRNTKVDNHMFKHKSRNSGTQRRTQSIEYLNIFMEKRLVKQA